MSKLYLDGASLSELFAIHHFARKAGDLRESKTHMWLHLPAGEDFPLYPIIEPTDKLIGFIRDNSIYGDDCSLDKNHYVSIVFRDDGSALVVLMFQHIIGSRWLCVVPQDEVRKFIASARSEE